MVPSRTVQLALSLLVWPGNVLLCSASQDHTQDHGNEREDHTTEHDHENLFHLGEELDENPVTLSVLFLFVTVVSLFLEKVIHWANHKAEEHEHVKEMLNAVYKELMILGSISLSLTLLQATPLEYSHITGETFPMELFEFVHIFLFFTAVLHVISFAVVFVHVRYTWGYWQTVENEGSRRSLAQYEALQAKLDAQGCLAYLNIPLLLQRERMRQGLYFLQTRKRFIQRQLLLLKNTADEWEDESGAGPGHAHSRLHRRYSRLSPRQPGVRRLLLQRFKFAKYLRRCFRQTLVTILEIDWKVWMMFMVAAALNITRVKVLGIFHSGYQGVPLFTGICWAFAVALFILFQFTHGALSRYQRKAALLTGDLSEDDIKLPRALAIPNSRSSKPSINSQQPNQLSEPLIAGGLPISRSLISESDDTRTYDHRPVAFLCGRPWLNVRLMQFLLMAESFLFSLYLLTFAYRTTSMSHYLWWDVLEVLPQILVQFVLLPRILPAYTLLAHVEELSDQASVKHVLTRMLDDSEKEEARVGRAHQHKEAQLHGGANSDVESESEQETGNEEGVEKDNSYAIDRDTLLLMRQRYQLHVEQHNQLVEQQNQLLTAAAQAEAVIKASPGPGTALLQEPDQHSAPPSPFHPTDKPDTDPPAAPSPSLPAASLPPAYSTSFASASSSSYREIEGR